MQYTNIIVQCNLFKQEICLNIYNLIPASCHKSQQLMLFLVKNVQHTNVCCVDKMQFCEVATDDVNSNYCHIKATIQF
jgi:hypothetical protein